MYFLINATNFLSPHSLICNPCTAANNGRTNAHGHIHKFNRPIITFIEAMLAKDAIPLTLGILVTFQHRAEMTIHILGRYTQHSIRSFLAYNFDVPNTIYVYRIALSAIGIKPVGTFIFLYFPHFHSSALPYTTPALWQTISSQSSTSQLSQSGANLPQSSVVSTTMLPTQHSSQPHSL